MSRPSRFSSVAVVASCVTAAVLVAVLAPATVVLGANRFVPLVILGCGAWVSVRRLGVVDLGTGAVAAVGAYAGAVAPALVGVPAAAGLVAGVVAGAALGGLSGAIAARVGRTASAVTTLALGAAVVALPVGWASAGGASGFHAVPLITGNDRGDLAVSAVLAIGAIAACRAARILPSFGVARAAVLAPAVVAATGMRPARAAAVGGAWAGAVLGLGGGLVATASGSVSPSAFGLTLSATLALAVLLGGSHAASGALGVALLYGPALLWPTAPVLGDAPLLLLAPLALGLLAFRPDGLLTAPLTARPDRGTDDPAPPTAPRPRLEPASLVLDGVATVPGRTVSLTVAPGEVVALVGPNGAGKSTLLARIGGQLGDAGRVRLGDRPLPRGSRSRARHGIARSWQRAAPDATAELVAAGRTSEADRSGLAWARRVLGPQADTPIGQDLQLVALQRPRVALLDEPGAHGDADVVAAFVRGLADAGCAVLLVEHRAELVAAADRIVSLTEDQA